MDTTNILQVLIATIMLLSTLITSYLTYKSIKSNEKHSKINNFTNLVKEDREIKHLLFSHYNPKIASSQNTEHLIKYYKEGDNLVFSFYEYLSSLYFENRIDEDLFFSYFIRQLEDIYKDFMDSPLFENESDRKTKFPYLANLFTRIGLSIESFSEQNSSSD